MEGKQLGLMKVIEFPKNRQVENIERNGKLEVAIKILKLLIDEGAGYHIVIDRKAANELFEGVLREYTVITSNLEKTKKFALNSRNYNIYPIEGNELN
jgi:hypothetical protein